MADAQTTLSSHQASHEPTGRIVALNVEGMMCQKNCGSTVRKALEAVPGVTRAEVSFDAGRAWAWISSKDPATTTALVEAVEDVGFGAGLPANIELTVEGMMCQRNCGATVKNALEAVAGVDRAESSFAEGRASVWVKGGVKLEELMDALESVGFGAEVAPNVVLEVEGMMCQKNCGATVEGALGAVPGVSRAEVSFPKKRARVWARDGPVLPASALVDAVEAVGFGACVARAHEADTKGVDVNSSLPSIPATVEGDEEVEVRLPKMLSHDGGKGFDLGIAVGVFAVSGMSCASCVGNVERFVSGLDGVEDVRVALLAEKAEIRFDPEIIDVQALSGGITDLGYPSRHLNTVLGRGADGAGRGGVGGGSVSLEVVGVSGSESIAKLEAEVLELPGVLSCTVSPALTTTATSGRPASSAAVSGFRADSCHYVLTASLTRPPSIPAPSQPSSGGGRGEKWTSVRAKQQHEEDALWAALNAVYDAKGVRKVAGVRDVLEAVRGTGCGVRLMGGTGGNASNMEASQDAEVAEWRRLLAVAVGFTAPVMVLHAIDHADGEDDLCGGQASYGTMMSWLLVTVVQVVVGRRFYRNAYKSARHGSFGMDMLVVVGTSISYLYSSLALLLVCVLPRDGDDSRPHLFLESPAMLLSFIVLGKFLEVLAKRKTSQALVLLLKAQPHRALLVEPGDSTVLSSSSKERLRDKGWRERSIEAALVQSGDVLRVLPGAQFPTDGIVLSGRTYVDESMITGESTPVAKGEGDYVCGGTANQHGSVLMQAGRVGEDTMLAQLCRLVEEAQMSKAPIQRQADNVASIFVPAVILASLVTFFGWFLAGETGMVPKDWLAEERSDPFLFALLFGVSVVVVACPCALGLATPTAVMVGTGVGAGNGVLIKGGAALEAAHRVTTVVFDKTGTLTEGKPFVTDVVPIPSTALDRLVAASPAAAAVAAASAKPSPKTSENVATAVAAASGVVLAIAAACEAGSEHPVGRAMVDAAAAAAAAAASAAGAAASSSDPSEVQKGSRGGGFTVADNATSSPSAKNPTKNVSAVLVAPSYDDRGEEEGGEGDLEKGPWQQQPQPQLPSTAPVVAIGPENVQGAGYNDQAATVATAATAETEAEAEAAVTDFVSEPGCGVAGNHSIGRVCVGTRAWAETNGGKRKSVGGGGSFGGGSGSLGAADRVMRRLEEEGKTAVMVTVDGEAVGVVAVADVDKEGSRRTVLALSRMGLDVWLVTGDNRRVAGALASRLGISRDRVMSEVLPAEKARKVQELQLAGGHVAMVGDGINDAPALATADVGIAVGAGTQVAMEAADMVLVGSDVCDVVSALHLGRTVFGRIKLNFVFAMLYNLCGVPVAAGVLYPFLHVRLPPAVAGFSMALSSISVVLSSLALRLYRKPEIDEEGRLWEHSMTSVILNSISVGNIGPSSTLLRRFAPHRFRVVRDEGGEVEDGRMAPLGQSESERWLSSVPSSRNVSNFAASATASSRRALERGKGSGANTGPYSLLRTYSGTPSPSPNKNNVFGRGGIAARVRRDTATDAGVRSCDGSEFGEEGSEGGVELTGHFV